ncbi:MAG: Nucleoside triphosphate pyrophosphohydrolase [Alphaproteobacteria bacterium MarineAlpha10_Bin2]|nr:MAG: Nucleoside triphosphate pyrophosphohydrolase [Alphaproteobacteria bacterium MarineAlpha10_Bin2]
MSEIIGNLLTVMTRLRDRENGCPWDIEQDFASIAPYTIEEAYEVAQAIQDSDMDALRDELGDLLLQVVYHAEMAREAGAFDFDDVAAGISEKMIRRHPHVFADTEIDDADQQSLAWETQKANERNARADENKTPASALDGIALALPALMRAEKLQKRAARVGFDWHDMAPVVEKIAEELAEVAEAGADGAQNEKLSLECGDLLFACVNLVRHMGIDAESALRQANAKFDRRFRRLESLVRDENRKPEQMSLAALEQIWQRVKKEQD